MKLPMAWGVLETARNPIVQDHYSVVCLGMIGLDALSYCLAKAF